MANEIQVEIRMKVAKGDCCMNEAPGVFNANWATVRSSEGIKLVGTTEGNLDLLDIGSIGWCWFKNLSTGSATIEIGRITAQPAFHALMKLAPGQFALVSLKDISVPAAKASASNTPLQYRLFST